MAKLSAHGTEVARITSSTMTPDSETTYEVKYVYSFRSDGHIMENRKVRFKSGAMDGEWHNYGWKLHRRFSDRNITRQRIAEYAQRKAEKMEAREGVTVELKLS